MLGIEQSEAISWFNIGEAQPDEFIGIPRIDRAEGAVGELLQQRSVFRDLIGGEEHALLEKRMIRRKVAQDFQYIGGDPLPYFIENCVESRSLDRRAEIGMRSELLL